MFWVARASADSTLQHSGPHVALGRTSDWPERVSIKLMHGGVAYPPTPGCFSEVLILNDFKSLSPELVILLGLKWRFSELVILKELRAKNGRLIRMCSAFIGGV
jgi:hypothetical protein